MASIWKNDGENGAFYNVTIICWTVTNPAIVATRPSHEAVSNDGDR